MLLQPALAFGHVHTVLDHPGDVAVFVQDRKRVNLDVARLALFCVVDVLDDSGLFSFLDDVQRTRMFLRIAGSVLAVHQGIAGTDAGAVGLTGRMVCQTDSTGSGINDVEGIRQRIEYRLEQLFALYPRRVILGGRQRDLLLFVVSFVHCQGLAEKTRQPYVSEPPSS